MLWVAFVNMSAGKYLFFFFFFFFPLCNLVIIYTSSVDCSLLLFERDRVILLGVMFKLLETIYLLVIPSIAVRAFPYYRLHLPWLLIPPFTHTHLFSSHHFSVSSSGVPCRCWPEMATALLDSGKSESAALSPPTEIDSLMGALVAAASWGALNGRSACNETKAG